MRRSLHAALLALGGFSTACGGVTTTGRGTGDSGTPTDATGDSTTPGDAVRGDSGMPGDRGGREATTPRDAAPDASATDGASNPEASVGDPCAQSSDCPVICAFGQCSPLCLDEAPFTGGYCSRAIGECPAPSPDAGSGPCPAGTFCVNGQPPVDGTGGDYCLLGCTSDGDCRAEQGYKCCPGLTHSGRSVCAPASLCP